MYFSLYEKGINVLHSNSKIKEPGLIPKLSRTHITRDTDQKIIIYNDNVGIFEPIFYSL